ncbi:MAG TPA: amino acid adenylation domain-containing protein, partial [Thermoanaerobaculia bacterium]|nr:amino acid adenylation domain-containing protein [Thermoanaerobaculia bacterium]
MYGPTETTVWSTCARIAETASGISIGKPIANTIVRILDARNGLCPIGVPGELCIGGRGLALGYWKRPELTAERFIADPYAPPGTALLYRTGDRARWRDDGTLEHLGRLDNQVKVRGFRIELGEIEAALAAHPAVREAVVLPHGGERLVAYAVAAESERPSAAVRAFLAERLPEYMVPAALAWVEALPLTPNGKLDRQALLRIEVEADAAPRTALVAPRNPIEELLAELFAEALQVERVGVEDGFFDLGGHSLLATRLVSRVRRAFGVELPLRDLFESPTVAGFAVRVERAMRAERQALRPEIEPAPRDAALPLSFAQQRLWFLYQLEPESPAYNVPTAVRLEGRLDVPVLAASLGEVVRRHESLRTVFAVAQGEPVQVVLPSVAVALPVVDLRGIPAAEGEIVRLVGDEARRPFDLEHGPLLRAALLATGEDEHVALLTMHHIVSDAWSMGVLVRELGTLYTAYAAGRPSPLPALAVQYPDFAVWQRRWLAGEVLEAELAWWRERLAGAPPALDLPTDRPRPAVATVRGNNVPFRLADGLRRDLQALSRRHGATLFMTLLGAFQTLLGRYANQEDVSLGSPIAGRGQLQTEELIGFFINTLVLRTDLAGGPSFSALLERVRETTLGAYAHQDLPFEKLVGELRPERSLNRTPLFQVMLILQNTPQQALEVPGLVLRPLAAETGVAKLDLMLSVEETAAGLAGFAQHNCDLFDAVTVERLLTHFRTLLEGACAAPDEPLADLSLLGEGERHQLAFGWNDTALADVPVACVHELFERQVERTPDADAAVFGGERLTFRQLDERANRLARYLRRLGVGPESRVALCLERSLYVPVAILGVLKAGGAYLPLDPGYPAERLAFVLADAGASVVVTQEHLQPSLPACTAVRLDADAERIAALPAGRLASATSATTPENLAYVIYTSGSTGRPKGVMIQHRSAANLVAALSATVYQGVDRPLRVALNAPLVFDGSVKQWLQMLSGHALYLLEEDDRLDMERLRSFLVRHAIEALDCTPTQLRHLLASGLLADPGIALSHVLVGGEAVPQDLWSELAASAAPVFWNVYGPTECTVDAAVAAMPSSSRPVLGRPIPNVHTHVLDAALRPLPLGAAGELCIGGAGLARGYLGRPDLTAERFVPDPWAPAPGDRLYRTGDLARLLADGRIESLGRIDHQVKVRGFRIELGEIEGTLLDHPGVRAAVVTVLEEARLVAYVVPSPARPDAAELRSFLQDRLPAYMVPAAFVALDALPLLPSGKVDRRSLPAPEWGGGGRAFVAPATAAEETLAGIWREVLRVPAVGVEDNFFELGGDSILSIQIVSRAARAGLRITPRQIFEHPTVVGLAAVAEAVQTAAADDGLVTGPLPLTPIQSRFFEQELPRPEHFNQALLLVAGEKLRADLLERTVARLLEHHDALRMRYEHAGGEWRQVDAPPSAETPFSWIDLGTFPREAVLADLQGSLDLTRGPLLRVALLTGDGSEGSDRLLLAIHHLVVDGVSWRVLLEDLETVYRQLARGEEPSLLSLPAKTASFQRWAWHLVELAASPEVEEQGSWWLERLQVPAAPLPVDFADGADTAGSARSVAVSLDEKETRALLQEVPRAYRTQINDVLLAALAEALSGWTGSRRILIDLEGHGRESDALDVSRTMGWFTALYPVVLDLEGVQAPGEVLKSVKEQLRAVPGRGLSYGLLRYLAPGEALRRLPAADVVFNYLGQLDGAVAEGRLLRGSGESAGPVRDPRQPRAHRLDVSGSVLGGRLRMVWSYSENRYLRETVEVLAERFATALRELIAHCLSPEAGGVTPSDFPLARLEQAGLDRLVAAAGGSVEDVYPASAVQQGMLFHSLYSPESGVYVTQLSLGISTALDEAAFEQAWRSVAQRHAILRTAFSWIDPEKPPLQVVLREVDLPWERQDWRALPAAEQEARLAAFLAEDRRRGLDLAAAPLMRMALFHLGEESYRFVWTHHHILLDGWSLPILLRDFFALYEAGAQGGEARLGRAHSYRDYVAWLGRQDLTQAEAYWRRTLAGFSAPTPLGVDRTAAPAGERAQGVVTARLSAGTTEALAAFARRHQLTVATLVQGAWALLLHRYSGETDVVYGAVMSGRSAPVPGIESMLGLFINTLPARVRIAPETPLPVWLQDLQERQAELRQHEQTPLSQVQLWSEMPAGRPLFESIFAFQNYPVDQSVREQAGRGLGLSAVEFSEQTSYPLTVAAAPGPRLSIEALYDARRFDGPAVARLLLHLEILLEGMLDRAGRPVAELPLLTAAEQHQTLVEWSDTAKPCPQEPMVHELFALHAARRPGAVAVASPSGMLTYGQVEARANRLAHHLASLGVGPDVLVAVCTERTLDRVVGIVAVLKAGGAYVSLDPTYPGERLAFLVEDAGAPVLLTEERCAAALPATAARVIRLDADWESVQGDESTAPRSGVTPDNLAYVIYTSGSTGRPKGVEIPHSGLMNLVRWHQDLYGVEPEDRGTQIASPAFDASIWELWPYLAGGASVHIPDEETRLSSSGMIRWWAEQGITLSFLITPLAEEVLEEPVPLGLDLRLRALITGGDRLHRRPAHGSPLRLMNHYGPSEYSVVTSVAPAPPAERPNEALPTLGRPIDGTRVYLLDRQGEPEPLGGVGELHVTGRGLARGYHRRPDLTAERFVPDPFSATPGGRLYKTGDLARFRRDGEIEYLGRSDAQVKVRGFRIELGEIESALASHPAVERAVVATHAFGPGDVRLVAWVVLLAGAEVGIGSLLSWVGERLPDYMVPAALSLLPSLPLTPNGKVDRRALPAPTDPSQAPAEAPRTPLEELVAGLWREVLGGRTIGLHDHFFALGGYSLLAIRLLARLRAATGVDLPLRALFAHPTVASLAAEVERCLERPASPSLQSPPPVEPAGLGDDAPAGPAQERLWYFHQLDRGGAVLNVPNPLRLSGPLRPEALARSLAAIARRHDSLRTTFFNGPEGLRQRIAPPSSSRASEDLSLPLADLSALPRDRREKEARRLTDAEAREPFDLGSGPLWRARLLRLEREEHRLLLTFHHVVVDGWSLGLLERELAERYPAYAGEAGAAPPAAEPEPVLQYSDFVAWQRRWLDREALAPHLAYWRERLAGVPPVLDLPADRPRPARPDFRGAARYLPLPPELARRVKELGQREGTTLFMTAFAAFAALLARYTGRTDLLVGSPAANRHTPGTGGIFGFFVGILPFRLDLSGDPTFRELLRRARESALGAYAHQDLPFERLVDDLGLARDKTRTPLVQVMLSVQNQSGEPLRFAGLTVETVETHSATSQFDFTLGVVDVPQGLTLQAEYSTELFDGATVERMLRHLTRLFAAATADPEVRLSALPTEIGPRPGAVIAA